MTRLLAVGHSMGPVHLTPGAAPDHHAVRIGWESHRLSDPDQVVVWRLAHGDPEGVPATPESVSSAATAAGVRDPGGALASLVGPGLVVEVAEENAEAFARAHRVQPLLAGLGNSAEDLMDSIGLLGLPPAARVRPRVFEVWRWAHLWPDLWSAAEGLAAAGAGDDGEPRSTAADELLGLLDAVQELLSAGAVHLDVARGGRPVRRHELRPLR
ncbi:hypothetical protein [Modestobacter sp. Leaf380]|uniref:hypothetical protein n=1 Tax=Modestobacter sp. Leaf380 TaxID=1736356 RepID=UPI0006FD0081|nr:hypothetical protein [Modestobacter sp. Leaf380]KQS73728.1 hypothetical protein ASG41_03820 [Modestobacter sp. Leaf380]